MTNASRYWHCFALGTTVSGGTQPFVWNGQDTGNQTLPTGQVIPNGWVAYNFDTSAIGDDEDGGMAVAV
ncbi:MAG: hypothetical protein JWM19_3608 [Actinomycetia bacterium]|nr:hypothetical protein [Actinomycetes bacterium]